MSETIEEKCLSKGVKLTDQRKVIAQVMSQSSDHPDVDELYNRVSKIDPKISRDASGAGPAPRSAREAAHRCATATRTRTRDCDGDASADERAMIAGLHALARENLKMKMVMT